MPSSYVELNAADARELGVGDGDRVRIVSRRGQLVLPARVGGNGEPHRSMVFVPFFAEEQLVNELTLDAYCPISGQPDYKKCAVRLEPLGDGA